MAQAASPWAPPTADRPGLLGVNWTKGWIIENNIIHDAKCSAISIGKEASTGHNLSSRRHQKPGYQYQMEAVFRALRSVGARKRSAHISSGIMRSMIADKTELSVIWVVLSVKFTTTTFTILQSNTNFWL